MVDIEDFDDWLSLEESDFVGHVYDLTMPIHLGDYDYDTLRKIAPDRAYLIDVHYRLSNLVNRFNSLNMIYLMLAVQTLPITSQRGAITKEAWVRIILDSLLSRLTSVRDCAYLLIAEIFELRVDEKNVSRATLRRNPTIPSNPFHSLIDDIADAGRDFRDERDHHLHRGEERSLGQDSITYKIASIIESWGQEPTGTDRFGNPIDLEGEHKKIIKQIESEFASTTEVLESELYKLFDEIYPIFLARYQAKRQLSQLE